MERTLQDGTMLCPKCESSQLYADKRGWSLATGFIGKNKIVITCLNCGKKFGPGEGAYKLQFPLTRPRSDFPY